MTATTQTYEDIVAAINAGVADDRFSDLVSVINRRSRRAGEEKSAAVGAGDKVRIHNLSPKYMEGVTADVLARHGSNLTLRITDTDALMPRNSRFTIGAQVTAPAACVRPMESE